MAYKLIELKSGKFVVKCGWFTYVDLKNNYMSWTKSSQHWSHCLATKEVAQAFIDNRTVK